MKRFTTQILTAIGFLTLMTLVGLWSTPKLIAAIKAALVQNIDEPGRNPYQEGSQADCSPNISCYVAFSAVPAGKRLVVTSVSVQMTLASGPGRRYAELGSSAVTPRIFLPSTYEGSFGGTDKYNVSQAVLAYFEAGDRPSLQLAADAGISGTQFSRLSGYFITLP